MTFKYSVCHPEREEIEYLNTPISKEQVLEIAKKHPWLDRLKFADEYDQNKIYYSPSLDFTCLEDNRSLGLTAHFDKDKELEFSLWYTRRKEVKILFGLLGKRMQTAVDDKWELSPAQAYDYLEKFTDGKYYQIEKLYEK